MKLKSYELKMYTIFSLSTNPQRVKLQIKGHWLAQDQNPTYLGVPFDSRLTWNTHTENGRNKAVKQTSLIKKLAGLDFGANLLILRKTYLGYVRPVLEYKNHFLGYCGI